MRRVKEIIVCEGKYDLNMLKQTVDATVLTTGGFQVFHDKKTQALLRRLAQERGVILLTDSDGAGFVIRNFLKGVLPVEQVKQAYIPDVPGKEKRKRLPGKEGKLGVEGMKPAVLIAALERAGATFDDCEAKLLHTEPITKADLLELGLIGANSAARRRALCGELALPEHLSSNGLLEVLNILYSREEFLRRARP